MLIKNNLDKSNTIFINIKKIDLKGMNAKDIKILITDNESNKFILAEKG